MSYLYKYLSLVTAFIFVSVIKSSPLESQISFMLAILIIMAVIYSVIQRRKANYNILFASNIGEIFFISSIVLLMIEITGGISSQLYFLNYFLLFGLPLISAPMISLIFTGSLILFYVPDLARGFNTEIILKIGSILLLLPLSYFITNELMKKQRENSDLKTKAKKIEEDAKDLELEEDDVASRDKLDEIIETAQDLEEK